MNLFTETSSPDSWVREEWVGSYSSDFGSEFVGWDLWWGSAETNWVRWPVTAAWWSVAATAWHACYQGTNHTTLTTFDKATNQCWPCFSAHMHSFVPSCFTGDWSRDRWRHLQSDIPPRDCDVRSSLLSQHDIAKCQHRPELPSRNQTVKSIASLCDSFPDWPTFTRLKWFGWESGTAYQWFYLMQNTWYWCDLIIKFHCITDIMVYSVSYPVQ